MVQPTQTEIDYFRGLSKPQQRRFRREKRAELEEEGKMTEKEINAFLREFAVSEKATPTSAVGVAGFQSGDIFYRALNRLDLKDMQGRNITRSQIEEGLPKVRLVVGNPNKDFITEEVKKSLEAYYKFNPEIKANVRKSITKIKNKMKDLENVEAAKKRTKMIKLDKRKYFSAGDLSSAKEREGIYAFWEKASKKFKPFEKALEKLLEECKNTEIFDDLLNQTEEAIIMAQDEIRAQDEKDAELEKTILKLNQYLETIKDKKSSFFKEVDSIESEFLGEDSQLEYIVKIDKLPTPAKIDPMDRVMDAILRMEKLEAELKLTDRDDKEEAQQEEEQDESQRGYEQAYLAEAETERLRGKTDFFSAGEIDDPSLDVKLEVREDLDKVTKIDTDPLLAIEMLKSKKLMALSEDSKILMKKVIDEIRTGETNINFISNLEKMAEEIADSVILEREQGYFLPLAVFKSKAASSYNIKRLPSAEKRTNLMLDNEGKSLIELFDRLHLLFTEERYSFLRYTTKGRGSGGSVTEYRDVKNLGTSTIDKQKLKRLFQENARQYPVVPAKRGKILSGLSDTDVGKALAGFLKALEDYYVTPLMAGKTPIAYPRYLKSAGLMALTSIAEELGQDTFMGDVATRMTGKAKTKVTSGELRAIARFFTVLDEPSVVVTDTLLQRAADAAKGLTSIFGREEDNLNTVAWILKDIMEQSDSEEYLSRRLPRDNLTINARFKKMNNKMNSKSFIAKLPIFILPFWLEINEGLLTRTNSLQRQYNSLKTVLSEIEEELPEVLSKLLKAHDEIRKALNKTVVYGTLGLKHDSYDKIVDKMYLEESIDLSHLEVERIVKAIDSHENIGKEYGISAEQVYLIKANFR